MLSPHSLALLQCPITHSALQQIENMLVSEKGTQYNITPDGIPLFAEHYCSAEAKQQQAHYDQVATAYLENLTYPHTQEYMAYLDRVFLEAAEGASLTSVAEICCGRGEAFELLGEKVVNGIGVDVSISMLNAAATQHNQESITFVQGDATMLPLATESFDSVFMLGGIHHVNNREKLFSEISRILKPDGKFFWREPASDFFLWRWLRAIIYRYSPALDSTTERPLQYHETLPPLNKAGLELKKWRTYGFLGFCFFMNSDILIFNKLFKYLPGIRPITRLAVHLDDFTTNLSGLKQSGLQVIGVAQKSNPVEL